MNLTLFAGAIALCFAIASPLSANGGAWAVGVASTGSGTARDPEHPTSVTIEEERLVIDLYQEFAEVDVHYRMRNTGSALEQDFFFPLKRWEADVGGYAIEVDGVVLPSTEIQPPPREAGVRWARTPPIREWWRQSSIPFEAGQTREAWVRRSSASRASAWHVARGSSAYARDNVFAAETNCHDLSPNTFPPLNSIYHSHRRNECTNREVFQQNHDLSPDTFSRAIHSRTFSHISDF